MSLTPNINFNSCPPCQLEWYGLVESKVRHLVGNLEREAIDLAHVWPKTYPSLEPGRETSCCYWFIGLQLRTARKEDGTPQSLDLTVPIRKFTEVVMSTATTTVGMWREGMKVEAVYKRRKELAHFLPPAERYKLKAEKPARSSSAASLTATKKSSSELKRRNSSVEEQQKAAAPVAAEQPTMTAAAAAENGDSGTTANPGTAVPSTEANSTESSSSSPPPVKRQKSPPPPATATAAAAATAPAAEASNSIVENSNGVQVT